LIGLDSNDVLNKLRKKHAVDKDGRHFGVDVDGTTGIQNTYENFVWEPLNIKKNILTSATEVIVFFLMRKGRLLRFVD
jgi:T-complex protein 1 subunit eta